MLVCAMAVSGGAAGFAGAANSATQNSSANTRQENNQDSFQDKDQSKDRDKNQKASEQGFHAAELISAGDVFIPVLSVANGLTILDVTVGKDGGTTDIEVVRNLPSATEASISAIRKWQFTTAKLDGKPVESHVTVGVVFNWNKDRITLPPVEPDPDAAEKIKPEIPFDAAQITAAELPGGFLPQTYAGSPATVILQATVGADGSVLYTKVMRDLPGQTVPSLKAMSGWEFKPAKFAGMPVRSVVIAVFAFRAYPYNNN
jgi:hypothetical protein